MNPCCRMQQHAALGADQITSSVEKAAPVLRTALLAGLDDSEDDVEAESVEPDRGLAGGGTVRGGDATPSRAGRAPKEPLRCPCTGRP